MSALLVNDTKGVVVGTWSRETFFLKKGDRIERTTIGQCKVHGKLLNMPAKVVDNLIANQRVVVVEE